MTDRHMGSKTLLCRIQVLFMVPNELHNTLQVLVISLRPQR
jgi:hypothetical protein